MGNYDITIGERKAKIIKNQVGGETLDITARDDKFKANEVGYCQINTKN